MLQWHVPFSYTVVAKRPAREGVNATVLVSDVRSSANAEEGALTMMAAIHREYTRDTEEAISITDNHCYNVHIVAKLSLHFCIFNI